MKFARCARAAAWAAVALWAGSVPVVAQDFPAKPIRLIVGFPPGGNADLGARIVAQKMAEGLGRPVVVENRTGAGGVVANAFVAKAAPDGYTLVLVIGGFVTQAATMKKLPYDSIRDFSPVSLLVSYPIVIAVSSDSKFKDLNELIGHAKSNPGKLSYGAPIGTLYHLLAEMFGSMAGIDMMFVPYRGGSEPMTEVMAGRLDVLFEAITNASPQLRAGRLRALAVTSAKSSPSLPNVPPVAQEMPGFETISFLGIAAPAGVPRPIVDRLNQEVRRAVESPDVRQRFAEWGGQSTPTSPEEMQRLIETEIAKWKRVAETRKIEIE